MYKKIVSGFLGVFLALSAPLIGFASQTVDSDPKDIGSYFTAENTLEDADTGYLMYVVNSPTFASIFSSVDYNLIPATSGVFTFQPLVDSFDYTFYLTTQPYTESMTLRFVFDQTSHLLSAIITDTTSSSSPSASNNAYITPSSDTNPPLLLGFWFRWGYMYFYVKTGDGSIKAYNVMLPSSSTSATGTNIYLQGTIANGMYILGLSQPDTPFSIDVFFRFWVSLYARCASTTTFFDWYYSYRRLESIDEALTGINDLSEQLRQLNETLNQNNYDEISGDHDIPDQTLSSPDYSAANELDSMSSDYNDQAYGAMSDTITAGLSLTGIWQGVQLASSVLQICFNGFSFYQAFLVIMVIFSLIGFLTGMMGYAKSRAINQARIDYYMSGSESHRASRDYYESKK